MATDALKKRFETEGFEVHSDNVAEELAGAAAIADRGDCQTGVAEELAERLAEGVPELAERGPPVRGGRRARGQREAEAPKPTGAPAAQR